MLKSSEEFPQFVTIESAIAELVDVLEHTPEDEKPEPWAVFMAVAEGYGEGVDFSFPVSWEGGLDA